MNTNNKTALDYDYEIIATHERLNRLLPYTKYDSGDKELLEIAELYKRLDSLVMARKEVSNWKFPDYSAIVELSRTAKERIAEALYINNEYDTRYVRTRIQKDMQFYKAYTRLTGKCPKIAF